MVSQVWVTRFNPIDQHRHEGPTSKDSGRGSTDTFCPVISNLGINGAHIEACTSSPSWMCYPWSVLNAMPGPSKAQQQHYVLNRTLLKSKVTESHAPWLESKLQPFCFPLCGVRTAQLPLQDFFFKGNYLIKEPVTGRNMEQRSPQLAIPTPV